MIAAVYVMGIVASVVMSALAWCWLATDDRVPLGLYMGGWGFFVPKWFGVLLFPALLVAVPFVWNPSPNTPVVVALVIDGFVLTFQFLAFAAARPDGRTP